MPREHGVLLLQGGPQGSHLEDVKNSRRPDLDGFIHVFIAPLDVIARHKVLRFHSNSSHCSPAFALGGRTLADNPGV